MKNNFNNIIDFNSAKLANINIINDYNTKAKNWLKAKNLKQLNKVKKLDFAKFKAYKVFKTGFFIIKAKLMLIELKQTFIKK